MGLETWQSEQFIILSNFSGCCSRAIYWAKPPLPFPISGGLPKWEHPGCSASSQRSWQLCKRCAGRPRAGKTKSSVLVRPQSSAWRRSRSGWFGSKWTALVPTAESTEFTLQQIWLADLNVARINVHIRSTFCSSERFSWWTIPPPARVDQDVPLEMPTQQLSGELLNYSVILKTSLLYLAHLCVWIMPSDRERINPDPCEWTETK